MSRKQQIDIAELMAVWLKGFGENLTEESKEDIERRIADIREGKRTEESSCKAP